VNAIVMAAGEGRRLRPLTECWPKPVLPIDGRPVIATLLRELAAAGVERVKVVTGHLADQVEALVGDGSAFGLELGFVRQPRPDGSADAVRLALEGGAALPVIVSTADTVFTSGDIAAFRAAFERSAAAGAMAVRRDPPPGPGGGQAVQVTDGRVEHVPDPTGRSPLAHASLWAFREALVGFLAELDGPPYELSAAFQRGVDRGEEVIAVEIGKTRDLTDPLDLVTENFPYLASGT
jgi:NDP-sugar pyrophosphorylase family protein